LAHNIRKKLDTSDSSYVHLTLILSLHYVVKCRSRSLAMYNNEFVLDSTLVGSEMINWKVTNTIGNYYISKSHTSHHILFITACAQNILRQRECKQQMLTPLTNNNLHFTR